MPLKQSQDYNGTAKARHPGFQPPGGSAEAKNRHIEYCSAEIPGANHEFQPWISDSPESSNKNFSAERLAQKWVSDLTYIITGEGWFYLTAILDLADRKVIGKALSDIMEGEVTIVATWQRAISNRPLNGVLLFHSDRGVQNACEEFREQWKGIFVRHSISGNGNCWDNAVAESFFKMLKTELVYHQRFATREQAGLTIFAYIEGCNRQ